MPYMMLSHKVANYAKWKRSVKSVAKLRKDSGEKCFYVCRLGKSPNHVMVWCEWDTTARMKKFAASAALRVAMKNAGVIGKPKIAFFDKMEDLTVK